MPLNDRDAGLEWPIGQLAGTDQAVFRHFRSAAVSSFHTPITEVALAKVRGERIPTTPSRNERRALTASAMDDVLAAALEYRGSHFYDPED